MSDASSLPKPAERDRYVNRVDPARVVTVTAVGTAYDESVDVAFEWGDGQPGVCRGSLPLDAFHRAYEPATVANDIREPTQLRWGLDDVLHGDDDTTTVLLSGPDGEPYWLELEPERAAALSGAVTPPMDEEQLTRQREQLLEAMSGVSEDRYCAGWSYGLERTLHEEGGLWETVGRAIGWPTGDYEAWTWLSWDEAGRHFAAEADALRARRVAQFFAGVNRARTLTTTFKETQS